MGAQEGPNRSCSQKSRKQGRVQVPCYQWTSIPIQVKRHCLIVARGIDSPVAASAKCLLCRGPGTELGSDNTGSKSWPCDAVVVFVMGKGKPWSDMIALDAFRRCLSIGRSGAPSPGGEQALNGCKPCLSLPLIHQGLII